MKLQTALITGASSGIGKALARKFANSGYDIVAVARQEDMLEDLAAELSRFRDISVTVIAKDLAQESAPQEIYDELKARKIVVDVLVNDAGIGQRGVFHETDLQNDHGKTAWAFYFMMAFMRVKIFNQLFDAFPQEETTTGQQKNIA